MQTMQLITALAIIQIKHPSSVITAIMFEDGSGTKFNYQLNSGTEWMFIHIDISSRVAAV